MYSRYHDRPVRVPENYGGIVFSEAGTSKDATPHRLEVAKPTPPPTSEDKEDPVGLPPRAVRLPLNEEERAALSVLPPDDSHKTEETGVPSEKPPHVNMGSGLPFLRGMKFDDLLLLSLLLLLSQSGTESDAVLWLTLLLFCG